MRNPSTRSPPMTEAGHRSLVGEQPARNCGHERYGIVYLLFFLSGAAGLIYEVSWSRQLGLLFGHTVHAASVVLAAFFAGMAAGNAIGGRWSPRVAPLAGYAVAEFAAAIWACLIPLALHLLETGGMYQYLSSNSPLVQILLRGAFAFWLLFPATTALGSTLPFIAEYVSPAERPVPARVALAYGLNTAGATVGVILATGVLLLALGVEASGYLAAGISVLCGLAAAVLAIPGRAARFQRPARTGAKDASHDGLQAWERADGRQRQWLSLAAFSGAGLLALQVLYIRMFSLVFHNSSYTFGAVVAVFLASLALGAVAVSQMGRWLGAEQIIAGSAGLGAIAVPASVLLFLFVTRLEYFVFGQSFATYLAATVGLVALVAWAPVTLLGMLLPGIWQAAAVASTGSGTMVGRLTAVNTLAAAVGSLAGSLLLLPLLGLWGSFALVGALLALLAVTLLWKYSRIGVGAVGVIAAALIFLVVIVPPRIRRDLLSSEQQLLRHWESPYGWVELVRNKTDGTIKVLQNLHYGLGTVQSDSLHYRQGLMPILLHEAPAEVLFIGLGTGMTAGAAIPHAEVERVTVVELAPDVVRAARQLGSWNNGVVGDPKVNVRIDDARHYLLGTTRRFDVIVSDLFVPWESRTGYLYTVEHYRAVRRRLKPAGLFCQWLPMYQMGAGQFESIANSFASVFPHTTLWWGRLNSTTPVLGIIGSEQSLAADGRAIDARLRALRRSPGRTDASIGSSDDLFFLYAGHWNRPESSARLNTDEHPRVEFLAPLAHRNATLLQENELRVFYDRVLARLPEGDVELQSDGAARDPRRASRRQWHRWMMFRSAVPDTTRE